MKKALKTKKYFSLSVCRRGNAAKGFTFIELAVVMAILATLSGLTVIWLGNFIAARTIYMDAMNMGSMARMAGEIAGAKGANVRFYFDLSTKSYWLTEYNQDGFYAESVSVQKKTLFEKTKVKQFITPRSSVTELDASNSSDYVTFYPDGSSENARLVLSDEKSNNYTVYFAQTTGAVKVYPYEVIY